MQDKDNAENTEALQQEDTGGSQKDTQDSTKRDDKKKLSWGSAGNGKKKRMKSKRRKLLDYPTIFTIILTVVMLTATTIQDVRDAIPTEGDLSYAEFNEMIKADKIDHIVYSKSEDTVQVYTKDGGKYSTINANYDEYKKDLLEKGVEIVTQKQTYSTAVISILVSLPMTFLLIFLASYLMRMMFTTKSNSFEVLKRNVKVTFDDVAGMTEVKEEVKFAVAILQNTKKLKDLGARPTKGILLEGPPGTGKTLLAKAIAGEADVPFIAASGSDFEEMFVGLGAARVRNLWYLAELNAPCVLFIDEIDAMGMDRRNKGAENYRQTLNTLLTQLDGLKGTEGILVIGATNRADTLDPALTRPGRFDKVIHVDIPDNKDDRKAIIEVHLKDKKTAEDIDTDKISSIMFGFSGADIENTLNEAVMCSLLDGREGVITVEDIETAATKLQVNGVIRDKVNEHDKLVAAVHEAGHTVMNKLLGRNVAKVTIQAYSSGVGGMTVQDESEDIQKHLKTEPELTQDIYILLAGGAAEELILGEHSQGWSNDIQRVTELVTCMYTQWGMFDSSIMVRPVTELKQADYDIINRYIETKFAEVKGELMNAADGINAIADMLAEQETLYIDTINTVLKQHGIGDGTVMHI